MNPWQWVGALLLGFALAAGAHGWIFGDWATFHRSIDFNREPFEDFMGPYYKQAMAMHGDQSLQPGFLYPPSFALFLAPLGVLSGWAASWTWAVILGLASLAYVLLVLQDRKPAGPMSAAAFTALFALSFPWVHDMHWGQVSTLLWACTLGGLIAWRRGRPWLAALGLSLGISIKLFPAWFLIAFALRGDWMGILRVMGLSVAFLLLLPWLCLGTGATAAFYADLVHWWQGSLQELFWQSEGTQFAPALLMRLWNGPTGFLRGLAWALPLLVALWILWRVRYWMRAGDLSRACVLLASALPLVLSPSWSHYFVWLPWGLWCFAGWVRTGPGRVILAAAAIVSTTPFFLWVGGHPTYPLAGYLTLAALALPFVDALEAQSETELRGAPR